MTVQNLQTCKSVTVIQFAYDSDQLAQGRINNIKFADIAEVLDGKTYDGKKFNWEEEQDPTEDNNYQKYKFDYRFKKNGTDEDEVYNSTSTGTVPYSRACMYNISQVLTDEKKIYVTKTGFEMLTVHILLTTAITKKSQSTRQQRLFVWMRTEMKSADMLITQQQTFQSTI